ncbi:MAG: hypothetical protein WCA15_16300, partial [Candidatus Acidiferrales bacterium]
MHQNQPSHVESAKPAASSSPAAEQEAAIDWDKQDQELRDRIKKAYPESSEDALTARYWLEKGYDGGDIREQLRDNELADLMDALEEEDRAEAGRTLPQQSDEIPRLKPGPRAESKSDHQEKTAADQDNIESAQPNLMPAHKIPNAILTVQMTSDKEKMHRNGDENEISSPLARQAGPPHSGEGSLFVGAQSTQAHNSSAQISSEASVAPMLSSAMPDSYVFGNDADTSEQSSASQSQSAEAKKEAAVDMDNREMRELLASFEHKMQNGAQPMEVDSKHSTGREGKRNTREAKPRDFALHEGRAQKLLKDGFTAQMAEDQGLDSTLVRSMRYLSSLETQRTSEPNAQINQQEQSKSKPEKTASKPIKPKKPESKELKLGDLKVFSAAPEPATPASSLLAPEHISSPWRCPLCSAQVKLTSSAKAKPIEHVRVAHSKAAHSKAMQSPTSRQLLIKSGLDLEIAQCGKIVTRMGLTNHSRQCKECKSAESDVSSLHKHKRLKPATAVVVLPPNANSQGDSVPRAMDIDSSGSDGKESKGEGARGEQDNNAKALHWLSQMSDEEIWAFGRRHDDVPQYVQSQHVAMFRQIARFILSALEGGAAQSFEDGVVLFFALEAHLLKRRGSGQRGMRRTKAAYQRAHSEVLRMMGGDQVREELPEGPEDKRKVQKEDETFEAVRRALRYLKLNLTGKAAAALISKPSLNPAKPEVQKQFASLFPANNAEQPQMPSQAPRVYIQPTKELKDAIGRLAKKGSAPGPSHQTGRHLAVLTGDSECLQCIAAICTSIANGELSKRLRRLLLTARGVPLPKENGGVRPISVRELLVRVTGTQVVRSCKDGISKAAGPHQLGLGDNGGVELLPHICQSALLSGTPMAVVAIDSRNAFNLIDRPYVLRESYSRPEIAAIWRYLNLCYGEPTDIDLFDRASKVVARIQSSQGVAQGCSSGSSAYAIAVARDLEAARRIADSDVVILSVLDGVYMIGSPDKLRAPMEEYTRASESHGCQIQPKKSE